MNVSFPAFCKAETAFDIAHSLFFLKITLCYPQQQGVCFQQKN